MANERILVVEDEATVAEVVGRYLERDGFKVRRVSDGARVMQTVADFRPDLVILDVMLPNRNGLDICRDLHASGSTPIILLTARGEESDKILGLGLGADDYVSKPFSPGELVARVKAVLRRAGGATPPVSGGVIRAGDFEIDTVTRRVTRAGMPIDLTAREFDILAYMAAYPGRVYTREQLLRDVWGYDFLGDDSTVTVHVRRLREKIEPDPSQPRYLTTVWSVGYRFEV
jgi:two-component system response regulator ResD